MLVGHSYGGAVITEAGTHDKVTALVYIAAFAPDKGESVKALDGDPDAPGSPICRRAWRVLVPRPGEVPRLRSVLTCPPQTPRSWPTPRSRGRWTPWTGPVTEPAWRGKPSWYLIATEDRMIPPSAQRAMAQRASATTVEVAASHAVYMSQPRAVAAFIRQACALGDRVPRAGLAGRALGHESVLREFGVTHAIGTVARQRWINAAARLAPSRRGHSDAAVLRAGSRHPHARQRSYEGLPWSTASYTDRNETNQHRKRLGRIPPCTGPSTQIRTELRNRPWWPPSVVSEPIENDCEDSQRGADHGGAA